MVSVEKLSISLDPDLAATVRAAAAEEGVSVSTWLARAAEAKARQRHLREALDEFAAQHGGLTKADIDRLITEARVASRDSEAGAA